MGLLPPFDDEQLSLPFSGLTYIVRPAIYKFPWKRVGMNILLDIDTWLHLLKPDLEDDKSKPGFGLPAQIIFDTYVADRIYMFRAILAMDEQIVEFDTLSISNRYDPKKYLHPSTIFFV